MSLGLTAAGLRECHSVDPVICLTRPSETLARYYRSEFDLETIRAPGLSQFHFSTVSPERMYDPRAIRRLLIALADARATISQADSIVRRTRADIVHVNSLPLALISVVASQGGYPVVQHVREPSRSYWAFRRWALSHMSLCADARIFLSEFDRESWGTGPNDVIIPNFVDTSYFRPPEAEERRYARESLGIEGDALVVLYVGGALQIKGAEFVLQLVRSLRARASSRGENFVFLMPGALRPRLSGRVAEAYRTTRILFGRPTLADRIRGLDAHDCSGAVRTYLLPPVRGMREIYWASDLLIAPNAVPHFSRPVVESAAVGLPAIASDLPGTRALIVDDVTGWLRPAHAVHDWHAELVTLARNQDQATDMGAAARNRAVELFDIRTATDLIYETYLRVRG